MWQSGFYKSIHGYVWLHKSCSRLFVNLDDISEPTDVDNTFFEVWTRRVGRSMGYPERLFTYEIVFHLGGYLRDDALMAVHGENKRNERLRQMQMLSTDT